MCLHLHAGLFDNRIRDVHLGEDELNFLVDIPRHPFIVYLDLQDSLEATFLVLKLMLRVLRRNVKAPILYTLTLIRLIG